MKKSVKVIIGIISVIVIISIVVTLGYIIISKLSTDEENNVGKIDDWQYKYESTNSDGMYSIPKGSSSSLSTKSSSFFSQTEMATDSVKNSGSGNVGLSVGGAKNIQNFRENIKNGYFPISTDITYNGIFYDYYFETGKSKNKTDLFSPAYSTAISKDPVSNKNEYYMTVGLNSNIKQSDFKRKKQNIVVMLDISGSMSSSLNSYYYDQSLISKIMKSENKTKMELANESVNLMIDKLHEDDRFGMVLFDSKAYLGKEITMINETDVKALKGHILEIEPKGGTNFEAGYEKATELFKDEFLKDEEYENRIIIITDAMPNTGTTSKNGLLKFIETNANNKIYTSLVGVGVDFNSDLTESISNVKGANYYSVSSKDQFKKILSEDFDYMVTPLVFDLKLDLNSDDYEIESIYGTDSLDKSTGNIMNVNTLFPSSTTEEGTKGGVILLKLKKKSNEIKDGKVTLNVSYKDREGNDFKNSEEVKFNESSEEYYENAGIRKSIALVRYVNTIKNWILYERAEENKEVFVIDELNGIKDCDYQKNEIKRMLGEYERTSVKLTVSEKYKETFKKLKEYITKEMEEVKDDNLKQEIEILDKLIN